MAFTYLKLTTFGQNLDAKCKLGKGLHLSRVAIGDGLLGNGSMVNRTALVSEKFSMLIDAKQLTEEGAVAAIISTLDNSSFMEGFPYRELGVMGVDPDTSQEGLYLYDNAGEECEYLDTQANGVTIYERIKLLIKTEDIDSITFEATGNPLYITVDEKGAVDGVASLGADGKVPSAQLPTMNYEAPIKDQAAKTPPVDADSVPVIDSADSSKTKLVLWSNIRAALQTAFNSIYAAATHTHAWSAITGIPSSFTPSAHKSTHSIGGSDAMKSTDLGLDSTTAAKFFESLVGTESVDQVLSKLASGMLYQTVTSNILLSDLADGDTFQLDETGDGTLVDFVRLKSDYESSGGVLVCRKKSPSDTTQFAASTSQFYSGSTLDAKLNTAYYGSLNSDISSQIITANIVATNSSWVHETLARKVFALSRAEYGVTISGSNESAEGSLISSIPAPDVTVWTRTRADSSTADYILSTKTGGRITPLTYYGYIPAFVLPNDFVVGTESNPAVVGTLGDLLSIPASQVSGRVQIATGSYDGTGMYGIANPITIPLGINAKFVIITAMQVNSTSYMIGETLFMDVELFKSLVAGSTAGFYQGFLPGSTTIPSVYRGTSDATSNDSIQICATNSTAYFNRTGVTYRVFAIGGAE